MAKGKKKRHKSKFNIPDPKGGFDAEKLGDFRFGMPTDKLNQLKEDKPVFSLKFISLKKGEFCFDSVKVDGAKDYVALFKGLKRISDITYDILSKDRRFHFHQVDFDDVSIKESSFIKCISINPAKIDPEQIPTLYQVKVFRESRVMGFFYSKIFHLVFFDVNHDGYARN